MSWLSGKSRGGIPRWWVVIVAVILVAAAIAIGVTLTGDKEADTTVAEGSLTTTSLIAEATTTESTPPQSSSTTSIAQASTSTTLPLAATTSSSSTTTSLWMVNPTVTLLMLPTRYEDTHPYLEWVGTWTSRTNSAYSGGSAKSSGTLNSRVGIEFEGTGVQLISRRSEIAGDLQVHLYGSNGVDILDTIHLGGIIPAQFATVVWSSGTLPDGQYQCWFTYDPANTIEEGVWVDAIDVWGTVLEP